jgi:integrase
VALDIIREMEAPLEGWTLEYAVERTYEARWEGSKGERTTMLNAQAAVAYFGAGTPLDAITTDRIDGYAGHLKERGNSNGTINRKLAALSAILRTAHERTKLRAMPHIPRQKEAEGRLRWLRDDEELRLLQTVLRLYPEVHGLTVFLLDTGLRLGEALRLTWRDVDLGLQGNRVHVWETKADKPRTVPLTARARNGLGAYAGDEVRVFAATPDQYRRQLAKACAVAGIEGVTPHTLRHTCASRLVQRGVALKVVQEFLGHKSITTTMRYAHIAPENLEAAVAVLEDRPAPTLRRVK